MIRSISDKIFPKQNDNGLEKRKRHVFRRVRLKEIFGLTGSGSRLKPRVFVFLLQDDRHAGVDRRDNGVGDSRDNRAGVERFSFRILPRVPNAGKREGQRIF